MNKCSKALLLAAAIFAGAAAGAAESAPATSKEQAAELAQKEVGGGKVVGIDEQTDYFDVKVLSGGKLRVVRIQKPQAE
jgi:nitrous oxide reductase accessory protein NosL